MTGLTEEKARFQVISMLTNTGFTTAESDVITTSRRRRKLARVTILFGYSFSVVIVSIVVNIFLELNNAQIHNLLASSILFVTISIFIIIITRSARLKTALDLFINKVFTALLLRNNANTILLMDSFGEKVMATISFAKLPNFLKDTPLKDSNIKQHYGVQILVIRRHGHLVEPITGDTILQKDDVVVVFGSEKNLHRLFE